MYDEWDNKVLENAVLQGAAYAIYFGDRAKKALKVKRVVPFPQPYLPPQHPTHRPRPAPAPVRAAQIPHQLVVVSPKKRSGGVKLTPPPLRQGWNFAMNQILMALMYKYGLHLAAAGAVGYAGYRLYKWLRPGPLKTKIAKLNSIHRSGQVVSRSRLSASYKRTQLSRLITAASKIK